MGKCLRIPDSKKKRPPRGSGTAQPGQRTGRRKIKKPAAPYSRTDEFRTTLGEGALDFRVRNGYGYDSPSMATGKKAGAWTPREPHRTRAEDPLPVKW